MYLQLPLRQWSAGNVKLLAFSSWKVNIAKKPHCSNAVVDMFGQAMAKPLGQTIHLDVKLTLHNDRGRKILYQLSVTKNTEKS